MRHHVRNAAFAMICLASHAVAATGAAGLWLDATGRAAIDIRPCGDKICGIIVWLKEPLTSQGTPKLDIHNADAAQRSRPICGLPLLAGFSPDGDDAWSGGTIYDPQKGETYSSNMHLQPDGTLSIRGYVGISLLGRSTIWTRPPGQLPHC